MRTEDWGLSVLGLNHREIEALDHWDRGSWAVGRGSLVGSGWPQIAQMDTDFFLETQWLVRM